MDDKTAKLEEVKKNILNTTLPLQDTATNLVFGKGNPEAPILFIGEAPGKNEDLEGYPFVGAAGKQLDKLLSLIDLGLDDVYIANILKYRPPKNRNPNVDEIKAHTPFLIEQIKVIKPAIIATLGNYATKFVLAGFEPDSMKQIEGITNLHGINKEILIKDEKFVVIPLYHPAAMLYRPQLREVIEKDISKMGDYLDKNHPSIQRRKKDPQTQLKF
ncbi:MAG: uracil-DNA glycosylase [Candidatus Woesearchaeota archaeon]|jgi:DNA polymerase|nr:uracil-DNA glycosylase [Candidatus Woesearchaeota archaeon]